MKIIISHKKIQVALSISLCLPFIGNVKDEINYAIPAAKGMIDAFIKHFEKFSASNFHVVIPVDSSKYN